MDELVRFLIVFKTVTFSCYMFISCGRNTSIAKELAINKFSDTSSYNAKYFSNEQLFALSQQTALPIDMLFRFDDTMEVFLGGPLIENPLGYSPFVDSVLQKDQINYHISALKIDKGHKKYNLVSNGIEFIIYESEFLDDGEYKSEAVLDYAKITKKGYCLRDRYCLGMKKDAFLSELFGNECFKEFGKVFEGIRVLKIEHTYEEMQGITFRFLQNELSEIIIEYIDPFE